MLLTVIANGAQAKDQKFIDFALEQAHSAGFKRCDAAIKAVFELAGGEDMRIDVRWKDETKKDSFEINSVYGSNGDSVYINSRYRFHANKCFMNKTTILTSSKSCVAYANETNAFKFNAEILDYSWFKNDGGVPMHLKPLNGGCIAIFHGDGTY